MIAFDTDVLTEILLGNGDFVARAAAIPIGEQEEPGEPGRTYVSYWTAKALSSHSQLKRRCAITSCNVLSHKFGTPFSRLD